MTDYTLLNPTGRRSTPLIQQSEASECGLACLAMVAGHHGLKTDLAALRTRFSLSLKGMTLKTLVGMAEQIGFHCRSLRGDIGDKIIDRSRTELEAFELLFAEPGLSSSMVRSEFVDRVQAIHRAVTGRRPEFRSGAMRTRPDDGDNTIIFPSSGLIDDLLGDLHRRLVTHFSAHPATAAVAAYVGLIHCHPFLDGNGRTARTLFNLVLSSVTETNHFVPVHQISALYRSSFLIKLRRAVYNSDWQPLQSFFCDAIRLSSRLQ